MMNLSRKILLASCASVAFLVAASACMVDEPDIEAKGKFVCTATPGCFDASNTCQAKTGQETKCKACSISNADSCLEGNVCVVVAPQLTEGRCVRADQVDHCHDYDKDTYMAATPGFEDECGFSEKFPMDCDDSDANVYPGPNATEYCDGKDNTCDGCIDGICPTGKDCIADDTLCKPLVELCFGIGTVEDVKGSVCSAETAGVRLCQGGKFVYAKQVAGEFQVKDKEACPLATAIGYVDSEFTYNKEKKGGTNFCGDGLDHDCNGIVNDGCDEKCDDKTIDLCIVDGSVLKTSGSAQTIDRNQFYADIKKNCNLTAMPDSNIPKEDLDIWIAKCSCAGRMKCPGETGVAVCLNNATEVTSSTKCVGTP